MGFGPSRPWVAALAVAVALASAVAGCMSAPASTRSDDVAGWHVRALEHGGGHDHTDASQHVARSTSNFHVVGHDALASPAFGGQPAGGHLCGDVQTMPDGRRIAAAESRSRLGFTLVDVTDASDPKWIGELVMDGTTVYDLAVVPDGRHVALVTERVDPAALGPPSPDPAATSSGARTDGSLRPPPASPVHGVDGGPSTGLLWRGACAQQDVPLGGPVLPLEPTQSAEDPVHRPLSLLLVDIGDPTQPTIVDQHPIYGEGHSAFSANLEGRTWILVTTHGVTLPPEVPGAVPHGIATGQFTGYEFYEVAATPVGPRLGFLSLYKPPGQAASGSEPGEGPVGPRGHDAWMAVHPVTGQLLAYLVGGDRFTILDMADPRLPQEVARWTDATPGRDGFSASLHSVVPLPTLRDGRHYTIVGPEFHDHPNKHPSGIIWVLDTTDPAKPQAVAGWTLPADVEWTGEYMFSNHYLNVVGDTLFVSMYHGGIWAVDLAGLKHGMSFTSLPSVGVFLPVDPTIDPATKVRWTPTLEEVLVLDGTTMATFDGWTGIWTFTFDAGRPAPAPTPWPLRPP